MSKILFINPPSIARRFVEQALAKKAIPFYQVRAIPLGFLYLAATLERERPDAEIRILDLATVYRDWVDIPDRPSTSFEALARDALGSMASDGFIPDLIGLSSLFSTSHGLLGIIANVVKERWPEAPVVVGGNHATNAYESLLGLADVDYVCRGEGEAIIDDLVQCVVEGGDPETIQGIIGSRKLAAARDGGGTAQEIAPFIDDLDSIPFPAWHLLPEEKYLARERNRTRFFDRTGGGAQAPILTTRGCPFKCTFCASWKVHGRKMRFRSTENILQELRILHERYGVTVISPEDDLFTVKKKRIIELCEAIADEFQGKLTFQFPNGLSVATLDEDVISAMNRMGMTVANIAIESGSDYVQRHNIKKNCNLDRARRVIGICRDSGIVTRAFFLLGFPGETLDQMQETIEFARSLPTDWNTFNVAAPLYGSEMFQDFLDRGEIDAGFSWDSANFDKRFFDTEIISAEDLTKLMYATNIDLNFFNNYNIRTRNYSRAIELFEDILQDYPWHAAAQYCVATCLNALGRKVEYQEALDKCRAMVSPDGNTLARDLYNRFRRYFVDLADADGKVSGPGDRARIADTWHN